MRHVVPIVSNVKRIKQIRSRTMATKCHSVDKSNSSSFAFIWAVMYFSSRRMQLSSQMALLHAWNAITLLSLFITVPFIPFSGSTVAPSSSPFSGEESRPFVVVTSPPSGNGTDVLLLLKRYLCLGLARGLLISSSGAIHSKNAFRICKMRHVVCDQIKSKINSAN